MIAHVWSIIGIMRVFWRFEYWPNDGKRTVVNMVCLSKPAKQKLEMSVNPSRAYPCRICFSRYYRLPGGQSCRFGGSIFNGVLTFKKSIPFRDFTNGRIFKMPSRFARFCMAATGPKRATEKQRAATADDSWEEMLPGGVMFLPSVGPRTSSVQCVRMI